MKVAIYCRLSAEDRDKLSADDDSASIQNQKDMLIKHAISNGWEIFGIYSDDDYSGADRNRPEFNRLIQDAKSKKFDTVLCKSQSRFTREVELVEQYIHTLFPMLGIRFISLVDNADTQFLSNGWCNLCKGFTVHNDLAGIGYDRAGKHLDQCALTCAVFTKQRMHFAFFKGNADIIQGNDTGILLSNRIQLQNCRQWDSPLT